jgi:hypothetical protein
MKNLLILMFSFAVALARAKESPPSTVTLENFKLSGDLSGGRAIFTLQGTARVQGPRGGALPLLTGSVALTEIGSNPKWSVQADEDRFVIHFDRAGNFPIQIQFEAAVRQSNGWKEVMFEVAPSTLQPISLHGLPPDTQFEISGAARPEYHEPEFNSFLAGNGAVKLRWKEAAPEAEGKLFYAAEMLSQVSVSPGLLQQAALLNFKVMQGELNRVIVLLHGNGEVTRVQGEQVLAWNIEPSGNPEERRLIIQFNQPQKEQFALQIQTQAALGAFPQTADVLQLHPEAATRFGGYIRVVNQGAVRLEVAQAKGLSQISPEQFPETELTRSALRISGSQRFAYRFSSDNFGLQIQADQILPELTVSEVLNYHLGQNELAIEGEFELDIREAPLRELNLRVPAGFAIAQLSSAGLSDYFQPESGNQTDVELRLLFGQPVSGRQLIQLRLERNKPLDGTTWTLPRVELPRAKSVRGHLAISADAGFRLSPEWTAGLTEIATAFYPRKVAGIQSAFRLSEPNWQLTARVEHLAQTVQADVLHLFSIGEGIAYGSSVINYVVSGAPVSVFKLELSDEYFNVEFAGKDVRNWQKVAGGYQVQLHTPVAGSYTLLATYERPFKPQGETLTFTGARPLDVQAEQGHTLIISAYQFQVKPIDVSPGLLPLEPGEVPAEYRLLFDAPVLAAYRYVARPFNLRLALSPLAQGDSLSLVVDRASLNTRISKEGQVLTDARYFVKNRGNPHLRLTLPSGTRLWSVAINGASVVPVADANSNLVPLPQGMDPNAVLTVDFKLAAVSTDPRHVQIIAPSVNAPVMLADWRLGADVGQKLIYQRGSLTPAGGQSDNSGFAQLARAFSSGQTKPTAGVLLATLGSIVIGLIAFRWSGGATHQFSHKHVAGLVVGVLSATIAAFLLSNFTSQIASRPNHVSGDLAFVAPVQQAGSALSVELLNLEAKASPIRDVASAWPVLFAAPAWILAYLLRSRTGKSLAFAAGWIALAGGTLLMADGATKFLIVVSAFVFVQLLGPAFIRSWRMPQHKHNLALSGAAGAGTATAGIALLAAVFLCASDCSASAQSRPAHPDSKFATANLLVQEIRVDDSFAFAIAKIHWDANKGQLLPLLFEPGVLTKISYPQDSLKLERVICAASPDGVASEKTPSWMQQLIAKRAGAFDLELSYQLPVITRGDETGFFLPVQSGLVNRLNLTLFSRDVDVSCPQAASIHAELTVSNTVADLVLSPAPKVWVGWKPRSRDVRKEKPVFYAELAQLFIPASGIVEAEHLVSLRVAQGQLSELSLDVPAGITITDVIDPAGTETIDAGTKPPSGLGVSLWRFDPDAHKLRITLKSPQARPFSLLIKSQIATGPLPLEQTLGLLSVLNAANQIGMAGIATGNEVQLDSATAQSLSPINLEDFPADLIARLQPRIPGLTLRRAFRYAQPAATLSVKASAVESDIRVDSQDTLSLGEDRTLLAVRATVGITRAGIFHLSLNLPPGFDVESVSGAALSHWTQSKSGSDQVITLHLTGKTEGQQQFAISLIGPGVRATNGWVAPQLVLREANKQSGTILVVPEQGLRLQVAAFDGLAQLDPQKSGIKQKGVLAFRVIQNSRNLVLNLEQVNAWIQVNSLQHAAVGEAQIKVAANLQYQVENAGIKTLRVFLPTNAESVRFQADQISDFLPVPSVQLNGLQAWEVRLSRRVLGTFLLQLNYQLPIQEKSNEALLRGVQAAEVNLQRGYVTVESANRLQVRIDSLPAALQPAEWQSIPRVLQQGMRGSAANFTYRLVEVDFALPLQLDRYQAAQMLPGRINSISFNSVVSDDGVMLTQAKLEMSPGSKRLLRLTLPPNAHFWFAFVSQNGVWPWRDQDQILIPLEQQAAGDNTVPVELFFTCKIGEAGRRSLDLELLAPRFDLPLENITWRVSISDKWELKKWSGSLQLQQDEIIPQTAALDVQGYLQNETFQQQQRTKQAEGLLAAANSALAQGDPQLARRAFQSAYGLSSHDAAFNEDARVQLHNVKLQEALVALNVRQAISGGEEGTLAGKFRELRDRKVANYTQQDAKDIIEHNTSDENAAFMKLAERLIQQQDAVAAVPAALHASIPEQGRVLTFKRAVLVDPWAPLKIDLKTAAAGVANWSLRGLILVSIFLFLAALHWLANMQQRTKSP